MICRSSELRTEVIEEIVVISPIYVVPAFMSSSFVFVSINKSWVEKDVLKSFSNWKVLAGDEDDA